MAHKGHQDVQRRTWDDAEYEARARDRQATERAGKKYKTQRELDEEEARERKRPAIASSAAGERADMALYDFKALVGTRREVAAENALSEQGGFYCEACDYLLKDQKSYLEHCNKPQHLQRMGMSTEVKRSTTEDIRAKLAGLKSKKTTLGDPPPGVVKAAEEKKKREEEELKNKKKKKKTKKEEKSKSVKEGVEVRVEELAFDPASMGLPSSFA